MPFVYILDVKRENNELFFENLFEPPNDAKTCSLHHDFAYS